MPLSKYPEISLWEETKWWNYPRCILCGKTKPRMYLFYHEEKHHRSFQDLAQVIWRL